MFWVRLLMKASFLGFNSVVHVMVGDWKRGNYGDFVNLKDLPAQSLKLLIRVGFVYKISNECAYVVNVIVLLCNCKKNSFAQQIHHGTA